MGSPRPSPVPSGSRFQVLSSSSEQENYEVLMWQEEQQALSEMAFAGNRGFWHFCGRRSESSESACYFAVLLLQRAGR